MLSYLGLLQQSLLLFVTFAGAVVTALVLGIAFHEFSHALVAFLLGDDTAKLRGRLSLNPMRHLDPMGTMFLLMAGFGWGKPTPVNPWRLRNGPKAGRAMVAAAGPISNILLAVLAAVPIRLGLVPLWPMDFVPSTRLLGTWGVADYVGLYLSALILFNIFLAVFNLIPIAPLDGFAVAVGLLPHDLAQTVASLEQYGPGILMLLLVLPFMTGGSFGIFIVMSPVINALNQLISGYGGRVVG